MNFLKNLPKLVNFCILKMEEKSNILNTLFFIISRKVKMQLKRKKKKKKICVMREESAVTD